MWVLWGGKALCQGLLDAAQGMAAASRNGMMQQLPACTRQMLLALPGCFGWHLMVPGPSGQVAQQQQQRAVTALSQAPTALQQHTLCWGLPSLQQQPQHQLLPVFSCVWPHRHPQQQQQLVPQSVRHFVLMPRRIKYRKAHKSLGFNETICPNTRQLAFGLYGIRALEHCRIPASTLEAVRRTMRRSIKKTAMLWIRVTPNVPVTSKPAEVRMGKGKGTLDYWAAPIRPGQIIFELDRCSRAAAQEAMRSIQAKMPIKVGFVEWN